MYGDRLHESCQPTVQIGHVLVTIYSHRLILKTPGKVLCNHEANSLDKHYNILTNQLMQQKSYVMLISSCRLYF